MAVTWQRGAVVHSVDPPSPMLPKLKNLACLAVLSFSLGCGYFQSPIDIQVRLKHYTWGDPIKVEFDFEEPPAGVTSEVRFFLVGYLDDPKSADGRVPVFEQSYGLVLNQALPGVTQITLPSLGFSLPASSSAVPKVAGSPAAVSSASTIRWAIVAREPSSGLEDVEEINIR